MWLGVVVLARILADVNPLKHSERLCNAPLTILPNGVTMTL